VISPSRHFSIDGNFNLQVHVWSNGEEPFPWAEAPPRGLPADAATGEKLAKLLDDTVIAGALIVQVCALIPLYARVCIDGL